MKGQVRDAPRDLAPKALRQDRLEASFAPWEHLPPVDLSLCGLHVTLEEHVGVPPTQSLLARMAPFRAPPSSPQLRVLPEKVKKLEGARADSGFSSHSIPSGLAITGANFSLRYEAEGERATLRVKYTGNFEPLLGALRLGLGHHLVRQGRGLLLHSSLALYLGHGVLFVGPSGTGKSTAVSSCPGQILSDEVSGITLREQSVSAWGTPFGNRILPSAQEAKAVEVMKIRKSTVEDLRPLPEKTSSTCSLGPRCCSLKTKRLWRCSYPWRSGSQRSSRPTPSPAQKRAPSGGPSWLPVSTKAIPMTTYRIPKGIAHKKLKEELFFITPKTSMIHTLDSVGAAMVDLLIQGKSPNAAAQILAEEYEASQTQIEADLHELILALLEQGLLEENT